jgi:hypothetical protein
MKALADLLAVSGAVFWLYLVMKWACRGAELLGKRYRQARGLVAAEKVTQAETAAAQASAHASLDRANADLAAQLERAGAEARENASRLAIAAAQAADAVTRDEN